MNTVAHFEYPWVSGFDEVIDASYRKGTVTDEPGTLLDAVGLYHCLDVGSRGDCTLTRQMIAVKTDFVSSEAQDLYVQGAKAAACALSAIHKESQYV